MQAPSSSLRSFPLLARPKNMKPNTVRRTGVRFNESPERASRPFDKDRDGFVLAGEARAGLRLLTNETIHFKFTVFRSVPWSIRLVLSATAALHCRSYLHMQTSPLSQSQTTETKYSMKINLPFRGVFFSLSSRSLTARPRHPLTRYRRLRTLPVNRRGRCRVGPGRNGTRAK